jgi:ABC-type dipeptide/oligopeptide/nickel transport system ATPase component
MEKQGTEPLVSVSNLKVSFRLDRDHVFDAVKGISFDIPKNATVALVGESGSGKSVTSLAILGLLPPENSIVDPASSILFGGRNIVGLPPGELRSLRGAEISMIFQEPMTSLNPVFTVGYQLIEVLRLHMGLSPAAARKRAIALPGRSRHPGSRVQDQRLPVADVGRTAAARDDRDGDRVRAQAADRRRADHRARRHDPEADPGPHRRAAEEAPDVGALHHARPRGRRRDRRPTSS